MKRARICILLALALVFVLGFGSTALAAEGEGEQVDQTLMHNPPPSAYEISATGESLWKVVHDWTIDKAVDTHGEVMLSVGESQIVDYAIVLTKGQGTETKGMGGTLTLTVKPGREINIREIKGWVHRQHDGSFDFKTLVHDKTYSEGTYTIPYTSMSNFYMPGNYRIEFSVDVKNSGDDKTAESPYFDFSQQQVNDSIAVIDTQDGSSLPSNVAAAPGAGYLGTWPVTETSTINYTVTFTNNGNKSGDSWPFNNTATIQETEQQASASVTVSVPKVSSGDPEPREERQNAVRWPDRTPPPEELESASVELPHTGGFIEWELLALAGGMLASGGGALYLARRRKMKK